MLHKTACSEFISPGHMKLPYILQLLLGITNEKGGETDHPRL